jgi:hypothetical protein
MVLPAGCLRAARPGACSGAWIGARIGFFDLSGSVCVNSLPGVRIGPLVSGISRVFSFVPAGGFRRRGFMLLEMSMVLGLIMGLIFVLALNIHTYLESKTRLSCKMRIYLMNTQMASMIMGKDFFPGDVLPTGFDLRVELVHHIWGDLGAAGNVGVSCPDGVSSYLWVFGPSKKVYMADAGELDSGLFSPLDVHGLDSPMAFCQLVDSSDYVVPVDGYFVDCDRHSWRSNALGFPPSDPGPRVWSGE